jgi:hypothetical protein
MASEWSNFAYYNVGDKVVYFAGLAGQQIYTATQANINSVPYPQPSADWSAGATITPSPATRVAYSDNVDYPSDGETESGGTFYAVVGAGRKATAPPSAYWTTSTTSISSGVSKWSNFVYYNLNDRVFNTASAGNGQGSFLCVLANKGQSTNNPTYWLALP